MCYTNVHVAVCVSVCMSYILSVLSYFQLCELPKLLTLRRLPVACMRRAATFHRLLHAQAFRSPMGKGTRTSSAQDVLFYELSRCARDANAAQALLAFDAATDNVSGAFEARIYHKLLALFVDRPSDSARVRQHMDERGVVRDETMVSLLPATLLPAEFPHGDHDTVAAGDAGGARPRPRR